MDHLNCGSDSHDNESITISFNCVKFESKQIDQAAAILLKKYQILADSIYSNDKNSTSGIDKMTEAD